MARFTWMDTYVFVEDGDDSQELRVGWITSRNEVDYSKKPVRWIGVITSIWAHGQQLMVTEFSRSSFGTNYQVRSKALTEQEILDSNLFVLTDDLTIASELGQLQAAVSADVFRARSSLEAAENQMDLVTSIFAPIRYASSEAHRASLVSPAQSVEAIIADMVAQGMLPLDEQAADARRQMNLENGEEVTS